jgi:hypothetical protein
MTKTSLEAGYDVVVANTFTTKKELQPYLDMASEYGIVPTIIKLEGKRFDSVHDVPYHTIMKMEERWENCAI